MAGQDNHGEFAKQVLRAVAHLYKHHPRAGTLSNSNILRATAQSREEVEAACGTIIWLYRNGIVTGEIEHVTQPYLKGAQLSATAYAQLRRPEENAGGVPLGQAAERAASGSDAREEAVIAELLLRRLS